jgi:hypothetical protein
MYKYNILDNMLPKDLVELIRIYMVESKEMIKQRFQSTLFCIDYYGLQESFGNKIFCNGKIISMRSYGRGIVEYIKEELTEKNRKDTIKTIHDMIIIARAL